MDRFLADMNPYQLGALVFNMCVLTTHVIHQALVMYQWRRAIGDDRAAQKASADLRVLRSLYLRWGIFPSGIDSVHVNKTEGTFKVIRRRPHFMCCYIKNVATTFTIRSIVSAERRRRDFTVWSVAMAVGLALSASLAVHFVPCLWTACDWGPDDEGYRGFIWFSVWGIVIIIMILTNFIACDIEIIGKDTNGTLKMVTVSGGHTCLASGRERYAEIDNLLQPSIDVEAVLAMYEDMGDSVL